MNFSTYLYLHSTIFFKGAYNLFPIHITLKLLGVLLKKNLWCWEKILSQNIFDRSVKDRLNNNNYQKKLKKNLLTVLKENAIFINDNFYPKTYNFQNFVFFFQNSDFSIQY